MLCISKLSALFVWQPVRGFPLSCSNVMCSHRILRVCLSLCTPLCPAETSPRHSFALGQHQIQIGLIYFQNVCCWFYCVGFMRTCFWTKLHNLSSKCDSLLHPTNNFPFWRHIGSADDSSFTIQTIPDG